MTFTYDPSGDRGKVRLLVPDRNSPGIFSDVEIDTFLALEGDVFRAAAGALEMIASDQALTLSAVKLMELQTHGDLVSAELRARASALRHRADTIEAESDGGFDIAEEVSTVFAYRERVWNQELRNRTG